jgi:hypothetical protein
VALAAKIANLEKRLDFQMELINDLLASRHSSALIETSSPNSFSVVDSTVGPILVALKSVEPYLTGYRVTLQLGNPHAVKIIGYTYDVWWSDRTIGDPGADTPDWYKNRKHRQLRGTVPLEPGSWRTTTIIFPETAAKDLKYIEVSININGVDMPIQPPQSR